MKNRLKTIELPIFDDFFNFLSAFDGYIMNYHALINGGKLCG